MKEFGLAWNWVVSRRNRWCPVYEGVVSCKWMSHARSHTHTHTQWYCRVSLWIFHTTPCHPVGPRFYWTVVKGVPPEWCYLLSTTSACHVLRGVRGLVIIQRKSTWKGTRFLFRCTHVCIACVMSFAKDCNRFVCGCVSYIYKHANVRNLYAFTSCRESDSGHLEYACLQYISL